MKEQARKMVKYHETRIEFLQHLLGGVLSPKQRREAEAELDSQAIKMMRARAQVALTKS